MLALVLGCGTASTVIGTIPSGDRPVDGVDSAIEDAPGDTSAEPVDTAPADTDDPEADAAFQETLFSDSMIHEVEITLSAESELGLHRDPYTFVPGDFTLDGEVLPNVGVRLRGKVGSFRELSGKPKFKIDFGEFEDGQHFHGLKSLSLNNEVVDCSYLKEPVAYRVYRDMGLPAGRTGFSHVTVNGEDYGLFVVVEVPDGKFLNTRFVDNDDGNLYDGKYLYNPDNGSYTMVDFATGVDDLFQLEEGVDNGHTDITAISDATTLFRGEEFDEGMDPLVDWGEWHTNWAAEQWVGHVDGYAMNRNNYRVYFRPSDGRMVVIPWDFDYAFIEDSSWGMSWRSPSGKLAKRCWTDASCLAAQTEAMRALAGTDAGGVDAAVLLPWYDGMVALIADQAMADPRRECRGQDVVAYQEYVRWWIETRSATMQTYWAI